MKFSCRTLYKFVAKFCTSILHYTVDVNNPPRGKSKVRNALLSLHDKGYITITNNGTKIKNNSVLEIELPDIKNEDIYANKVRSGSWTYYGFTSLTHDIYRRTKNAEQLKVLVYVIWRSFENTLTKSKYAISYYEWESVLQVAHQTAVNILKECVKDGLITKLRGDYYITDSGETRQETNRYSVKEKADIINPEEDIFTNVLMNDYEAQSKENRKHQWFEKDSILTVEDFIVLKTTFCSKVRGIAERRINGISASSESGKKAMETLDGKAQNELRKKEVEKRLNAKRDAEALEEMELNSRRYSRHVEHTYEHKKNLNDISDILEDEPVNECEFSGIFG